MRRVWLPDAAGSVICKEPLGPGSVARAEREVGILRRLAGVTGVPQLATVTQPGTVVVVDDGGVPLMEAVRAQPLDASSIPALACDLASIVGAMHRNGVVHRDINPANVLLTAERRLVVVDFDLASTVAEDLPGFTHHRDIAGTLPYLAPEQTGRTGMAVDHRADLYGVGALLYELVAGRPPFEADDELQLVRDILVRVPTPLVELNATLPQALSDIVMLLMEKSPDRRYQSAEGLVHDLGRLRAAPGGFGLGERDFPPRLSAPSRLVGRDGEIAVLRAVFEDAMAGSARGALVAGAPGVGKSALVNALRPIVADRGGWFVGGKFDQYRPDAAGGAVVQAMRGLGRLLLAEPEEALAVRREAIRRALGSDAGLVGSVLPEFAVLLGAAQEPVSVAVVEVQSRLRQALLDLLGAVVSVECPVVMVLDDLQWADAATLGLLDAVLGGDGPPGLLLVGAYRSAEVDTTHPLAAMMSRWERLDIAPALLCLENLPPSELSVLLAEMLRLPAARAGVLATLVGEWTGGNPYDTVELVNALRRDGILRLGEAGWSWDEWAIRRYVGRGDIVDLLRERIDRLPPESGELLGAMACLGGEVRLDLLAVGAGLPAIAVRERLAAPLEDGLLVLDQAVGHAGDEGRDSVRFRHDRVHQAAYDGLGPEHRSVLRLSLARRLGPVPECAAEAAEQYLAIVGLVRGVDERCRAADLFRVAATSLTRTSNHAAAERFLAAAIAIRESAGGRADGDLVAMAIERHAALYSLGRLDEADRAYASIRRHGPTPEQLAPATCVQVSSLGQRGRYRDAADLGLDLLRELGATVPDEAFSAQIPARLDELSRWASRLDLAGELARPDVTEPRVLAIAGIIDRLAPIAYFLGDRGLIAWIASESQRLWLRYGPCAQLVANFGAAGPMAVAARGDYRLGHTIGRHMLAVAQTRGYEPQTSVVRHRHTLLDLPWMERLDTIAGQARAAREGLVRGGHLQMASHTYNASLPALLDCAGSLETYVAEIASATAFAARIGDHHTAQFLAGHRQLAKALRGEAGSPGGFDDESFAEQAHLLAVETNPLAAGSYHICRALAAALFGDASALDRHTGQAMPLLRFVPGYPVALAYVLRGLALCAGLRGTAPDQAPAMLAELADCQAWLAARTVDAPGNFRHLLRLVDAERAWAFDDFRAAATAFDEAAREAERRPWHQALITERDAQFHFAYGLDRAGRRLLAEARQRYQAWGAAGKVRELERVHPFLRPGRGTDATRATIDPRRNSGISADSIDMVAILRASQALSSETNLDRLRAEVGVQLTALTGATDVMLVLRNDDTNEWFLPSAQAATPVDPAGAAGLLPTTAFRYVERTREPLLVEDATTDDRFTRDPYLAGHDCCSLLVVPILHQGALHAVLLLANDVSAGAFTADRLDAVMLIAGQLSVSLGNALLYGSLEERVAERTEALAAANQQLEVLSATDPLTKLANRRRFTQVLEAEWVRATRTGRPVGIIMLDVDYFKRYNDHYGHLAGDECLSQVAAALESGMRNATDLVCRYGGEEFAIIVPEVDQATVCKVGERARVAVAALQRPHAASEHGTVTVSVGVATMRPTGSDLIDDLVNRADAALYQAKANGRNQVCG